MIKLLLALIMMFTFGTSTVNAEEDTTGIKDRISELAHTKLDSQSIINAEVDKLSEDELKAVIASIDELTEPSEEDLVIKEAAISRLEEIEEAEVSPLTIVIGAIGLGLVASALIMSLMGYHAESKMPLIIGMLLIMVLRLLAK